MTIDFVTSFHLMYKLVDRQFDIPYWAYNIHCVSKKQDTKLLPITSPNVNRFSKFFH